MSMDPSQGPALPPELMQAIQSRIGGGDPSASGPSPDPSQAPPSPDQSQGPSDSEGSSDLPSDPVALLQSMIEAAKKYLEVEPDEEDKLTMSKVLTQLQQYLAKDQKDSEQMMGGTISPRAMRKAGPSGA